MIHAYDKIYLDKAQAALGRMLDFAVYDLKYDIAEFFELFLSSGVAARFEKGDYSVITGMSGVELAYKVLEMSGIHSDHIKPQYPVDRSEEFWTGWVLAYYQWETARCFADIIRFVPVNSILSLYSPYHEMDIRQFCDKMNELYRTAKNRANMKLLRQNAT